MAEIWASCWGRLGALRQASISYKLSGMSRGIVTVMVSVPPRDAHQPPLVLVSRAGQAAAVAFGLVRRKPGNRPPSWGSHTGETCPGAAGLRGVWY